MEVIAILSFLLMFWLIWQLIQAKKYTRFKRYITTDLTPLVTEKIQQELKDNRSALFPNNEVHTQATLYYWTEYRIRILQYALKHEIIDEDWFKKSGYLRQSQHLFHIESFALNRSL